MHVQQSCPVSCQFLRPHIQGAFQQIQIGQLLTYLSRLRGGSKSWEQMQRAPSSTASFIQAVNCQPGVFKHGQVDNLSGMRMLQRWKTIFWIKKKNFSQYSNNLATWALFTREEIQAKMLSGAPKVRGNLWTCSVCLSPWPGLFLHPYSCLSRIQAKRLHPQI